MSINIKLSCGKSTGMRILEESYGDISTKSKSRQATNTVFSQEMFIQEYIYLFTVYAHIYLRLAAPKSQGRWFDSFQRAYFSELLLQALSNKRVIFTLKQSHLSTIIQEP